MTWANGGLELRNVNVRQLEGAYAKEKRIDEVGVFFLFVVADFYST